MNSESTAAEHVPRSTTSSPQSTAGQAPPIKAKNALDSAVLRFNRWHAAVLAVTVLFTAVINLEVFLERQWPLAGSTTLLGIVGAAIWIVADRRRTLAGKSPAALRLAAIGVLTLIVPLTLAVFFGLTMTPRLSEDGPIIAVSRFDGPVLPDPYQSCRPSDVLVGALADVQNRFGHITTFELPYGVDPSGRWSGTWATWHGMLEGADVVIYGEYSLVSSAESSEPNVLIKAHANRVPLIALGRKTAPLSVWDFPARVVALGELCTASSERFIHDGKRLALAVAGLQAVANEHFVSAAAALDEAENAFPDGADPQSSQAQSNRRNARCDRAPTATAECSGVLAFYLAVLNERFGRILQATREYTYAAAKLHTSAPLTNLAELDVLQGDGASALRLLREAVSADPSSVAALATLAQYEDQYGDVAQADNDLRRARQLVTRDAYDTIALSRALFARKEAGAQSEALRLLGRVIHGGPFAPPVSRELRIDAEVDYGRWLLSEHDTEPAIAAFEDVLQQNPLHIKANYELALALAAKRDGERDAALRAQLHADILAHDLTAINASAFTDDELTDQGNAAAQLGNTGSAMRLYDAAISVNSHAVYAFAGRAELFKRRRAFAQAIADYLRAVRIHPRETELRTRLAEVANLARAASASATTLSPTPAIRIAANARNLRDL